MKYLRLHKCQDEQSFIVDASCGSNNVQNSANDNKKVKSLMEAMQRVVSSRVRKHQSAETAASSGCNVLQLDSQKSISRTN